MQNEILPDPNCGLVDYFDLEEYMTTVLSRRKK